VPGSHECATPYSSRLPPTPLVRPLDAALRQFGNIAGVMGWVTLLGVVGSAAAIALKGF
jgi:hypothetical protein